MSLVGRCERCGTVDVLHYEPGRGSAAGHRPSLCGDCRHAEQARIEGVHDHRRIQP